MSSSGVPTPSAPRFTDTKIVHHSDGSASVYHTNADDPSKSVSYAVSDLAGVHAGLEKHLKQVAANQTAAGLDPDD